MTATGSMPGQAWCSLAWSAFNGIWEPGSLSSGPDLRHRSRGTFRILSPDPSWVAAPIQREHVALGGAGRCLFHPPSRCSRFEGASADGKARPPWETTICPEGAGRAGLPSVPPTGHEAGGPSTLFSGRLLCPPSGEPGAGWEEQGRHWLEVDQD